jgi:hypothetical protein
VLVTITALLLSACTSSAPKHQTGPCQAGCTGVIDGAHYLIKMPANWNGTLLLYSHGYQFGGAPPRLMLSPQDLSGTGDDALSRNLLDKGFALAGSSWSSTGWAVQGGVDSAVKLYKKFTEAVSKPNRVYAWGSSLGGLVTELLAERADWVNGAAPMCGVVGGPLPNFDNWLEAQVAAQALLGVKYPLTGRLSVDQANQEKLGVNAALNAARRDRAGGGEAKLLYVADLLGLPDKSQLSFDDSQAGQVGAAVQNLAGYLYNGALFLAEARAEFGGNPARTHPANKAPLTPAERATITALHGNPETYAAQVDAAKAPATSSAARHKLAASGDPTGNLRVPTVSMHGIDDPLAIVQNETLLGEAVKAKDQTKRLIQLFIAPDDTEPAKGYIHCAFSANQDIGLIETLDQWVRQGPRPASNDVVDNVGGGFDSSYAALKWPSGAVH